MNQAELIKKFTPSKLVLPIILGLGVATWLLLRNFDASAFKEINWSSTAFFGVFCAVCMVILRDLAYMYRIKLLTNNELSWKQSINVILLWEFASAITPSIVGGTAFALFILMREGIGAGRSTTIVLLTAFLDELFFIIIAPLVFLFVGSANIFKNLNNDNLEITNTMQSGLVSVFWIGYLILLAYTLLLAYGLFINPNGLKKLVVIIFRLRFLKKYRFKALREANNILLASEELKEKSKSFWVKAFGSTIVSWSARYMVINFLILAFPSADFVSTFFTQMIIYARQVVMWIIMLITPTPGSSGVAEFVFDNFLREFVPKGLGAAMALLWRLLSYYPYLFIGAFLLPRWLSKFKISAAKS